MGILNVPFPLFAWLDGVLRGLLPPLALIVFWGLAGSLVSMLLYRLLSKQQTISRVSAEAAEARRELIGYDGGFAGFRSLTKKALALSARQFRLTAGPAVIASLPLVSLIAWLSLTYAYAFAEPGSIVEVKTYPEGINARWEPAATQPRGQKVWRVPWPPAGQTIRLIDGDGREVFALPPSAPVPIVHKRKWWNAILGNPAGYLPEDAALEGIEMELPDIAYVEFGQSWMRSWEATFFVTLLLCSLAIKIAFRIK